MSEFQNAKTEFWKAVAWMYRKDDQHTWLEWQNDRDQDVNWKNTQIWYLFRLFKHFWIDNGYNSFVILI